MIPRSPRFILVLLPGVAPAAIKAVIDLAHDELGDAVERQQDRALVEPKNRVRHLEEAQALGRRISDNRLVVLEFILDAALSEHWASPEMEQVVEGCSLRLLQVKKAYEDLAEVGLVCLHGNANHVSGHARATLEPTAYLRVGTSLLSATPVVGELRMVLSLLKQTQERRLRTSALLVRTGIPLPRLDLLLHAMAA